MPILFFFFNFQYDFKNCEKFNFWTDENSHVVNLQLRAVLRTPLMTSHLIVLQLIKQYNTCGMPEVNDVS